MKYYSNAQFDDLLSASQQQEIVAALKKGYLPSKYHYLFKHFLEKYWIDKETQRRQKKTEQLNAAPLFSFRNSYMFLMPIMESYWKNSDVVLIDFGSGTGLPVKELQQSLYNRGKASAYIPVDFSSEFLAIASANHKKWFPTIPKYPLVLDYDGTEFENSVEEHLNVLSQDAARVYVFIGMTSSNMRDLPKVLKSFQRLLRPQDGLLIDIPQPLGMHSRNMEYFHKEMDWRLAILVAMGLPKEVMQKDIYYDEALKRKYIGIELLENCQLIGSGKIDYQLDLSKGQKIELIFSQQYEPEHSVRLISDAKLSIKGYYSSPDGFVGLFFCTL